MLRTSSSPGQIQRLEILLMWPLMRTHLARPPRDSTSTSRISSSKRRQAVSGINLSNFLMILVYIILIIPMYLLMYFNIKFV